MNGAVFFVGMMVLGMGLLGFGGLAGLQARRARARELERAELRLALEFSLATVFFALLPFMVYLLSDYEPFIWRLTSSVIAMYLLVAIGRVYHRIHRMGASWPIAMISLLVLSGFLLTIELVNVFWWASLAGYAWGLLWILLLAGIQYVAFVTYDHKPAQIQPTAHRNARPWPERRGDPRREWMRRHDPTDYPYVASNRDRDTHSTSYSDARRRRIAYGFRNSTRSNRRPISDATTWSHPNTRR